MAGDDQTTGDDRSQVGSPARGVSNDPNPATPIDRNEDVNRPAPSENDTRREHQAVPTASRDVSNPDCEKGRRETHHEGPAETAAPEKERIMRSKKSRLASVVVTAATNRVEPTGPLRDTPPYVHPEALRQRRPVTRQQEEVNRLLAGQISELTRELSSYDRRQQSPPPRAHRRALSEKTWQRSVHGDDLPPPRKGSRSQQPTRNYPHSNLEGSDTDQETSGDRQETRCPDRSSSRNHGTSVTSLRREIEEMRSMIRRAASSAPEVDDLVAETENSPFTARMIRTKVPLNDKLRLPTYDGTGDPSSFLRSFNVKVGRADFGKASEDQGKCQLFVESLRGEAQAWFTRLPENSVGSFEDLRTAFLGQYMIFREYPPTTYDLCKLRQQPKESLGAFVRRFRDVYSKIKVSDDLAIDALTHAIPRGSRLWNDLASRRPNSVNDAFFRANTHIRIEEQETRGAGADLKVAKDKRTEEKKEPRQPLEREQKRKERPRDLAVTATVGRDAKKPWNNTYRRDASEPVNPWCHYHKRPCHRTEDCPDLNARLMEGYLHPDRSLIGSEKKDTVEETSPGPPRHRINMVVGAGSIHAIPRMESSLIRMANKQPSLRKEHQRRLGFPEPSREELASADLLTVELQIADSHITGVLVDSGSLVDLIDLLVLGMIGTDPEKVKLGPKTLTTFGGNTVTTIGSVNLPVTAGGVTKVVEFQVVDRQFGYSAIMGVPWLHSMKAIVSIYHRCVKFPTDLGYFTMHAHSIHQDWKAEQVVEARGKKLKLRLRSRKKEEKGMKTKRQKK